MCNMSLINLLRLVMYFCRFLYGEELILSKFIDFNHFMMIGFFIFVSFMFALRCICL